ELDWLLGVAVDGSGNIYATGSAMSANLPTTAGVVQPALNSKVGGEGDAFIAKISVAASTGPVITSVKNAASYATNAYSPGEYVAIFGSGLGPAKGVLGTVSNGKVTTSNSGVSVT